MGSAVVYVIFSTAMDTASIPLKEDFTLKIAGITKTRQSCAWFSSTQLRVTFAGYTTGEALFSYVRNASRDMHKSGDTSKYVPTFTDLVLPYSE